MKIAGILEKMVKMHRFKRIFFLLYVYKMIEISAETFAENCIHTIIQLKKGKEPVLWIRTKDRKLEGN